MSPSSPNPVSASSKKLSRSRSSTAQGSAGSTAEGGAAASAAGAGSAATAAASAVEGRLGLLGGVATAGLAGPPHEQDHPAAVRSFSSFYFPLRRREGRRSSWAVERRRSEKGRGRKEEIRPLWYRARLDLAAAAATVTPATSTCSLFSCSRGSSSRPSSSSSSKRRLRLSPPLLAARGACYGVLGEPQ